MRYRSRVFALAMLTAALAAPPAAVAAAPPFHATADSVHEPGTSLHRPAYSVQLAPLTVQAVPESVRVYLLTQLEIPKALGDDSLRLKQHVERAIVATMAGLMSAQVPVHSGMVFLRDHDVPSLAPSQRSDSIPAAVRRLNHAAWAARAASVRPSLIRLTRR